MDALNKLNSALASQGVQVSTNTNILRGSDANQAAVKAAHPSPTSGISAIPGQVAHIAAAAGKGILEVTGIPQTIAHTTGADFKDIAARADAAQARASKISADWKAGKYNGDKNKYKADLQASIKELQDSSNESHGYNKDYTKNLAIDEAKVGGTILTAAAALPVFGAEAAAGAGGVGAAEGVAATSAATKASKISGLISKTSDGLDAALGAGKTMGNNSTIRGVAKTVAGKATRNALVTEPTIDMTLETAKDLGDHHYKQAAINAGILIGTPIAAGVVAPKVVAGAKALGTKVFGTRSFLDEIPTANGQKISGFLKTPEGEKYQDTAKVMQQYNLNQSHGDISNAVEYYKNWLGADATTMTAEQHLKDFQTMVDEVNSYRSAALSGEIPKPGGGKWTPDEVKNLWVGRFSTNDRTQIVNELQGLNNAERVNKIDELAAQTPWGKNEHLVNQLKDAAAEENFQAKIARLNPTVDLRGLPKDSYAIEGTPAADAAAGDKDAQAFLDSTGGEMKGAPAEEASTMTQGDNKYIPIMRARGTDVPNLADSGEIIAGKKGTAFGDAVTKAGLSPHATADGAVTAQVKNSFGEAMDNSSSPILKGNGDKIYGALRSEMDNHGGVYDPRMLTKGQVLNALGAKATEGDAEEVIREMREAYAKVTAEAAGLMPKVVNQVMKDAPLMNQYLKVQGIAKFSANPFFYLKRLSKSGIIAVLHGATSYGMSAETEQTMREAGYWSKYIQDMGTADFFGNEIGQSGKNQLSGPLKNIVGGMAESMAKANGMTVKEALDNPEVGPEIDHAIRTALGYPKGGYINSPLAKTLNILIFPSRFETKVAMAVGHAFAKQPAVVQAAIVTDLANMKTFLDSPQGQQWQKDNSETLNLVKYFTPLSTIDNINKFLNDGHHIGDLGEIGGLPFGVITQILQHQSPAINDAMTSEYRDPKTGEVVPSTFPVTLKGRVQQLVTDLIQSTFSWPGKQAGLDLSKGDIVSSLPGLKKNPADFETEQVDPSENPGNALPGQPVGGSQEAPAPNVHDVTVSPIYSGSSSGPKAKRTVPANLQIHP